MSKRDKTERQELHEERKEVHFLECICEQLKLLNEFFRAPKSFSISQEGSKMGVINGIQQGGTGKFSATPLPAGSSVGSVVPTWTSSDTANTSLTPSADGLSVSVAVGPGLAVGSAFTLTVSATSPDGTVTAVGTASVPVLAPTPTFPTSFDINQTA